MGNPGIRYEKTRHNVGFKVVDYLAQSRGARLKRGFLSRYTLGRIDEAKSRFYLVKPLTYMNRSGEVVRPVLSRTRLDVTNLIVVCDTLDLPVGRCRLKKKGSSGGHRGLASIIQYVDTEDVTRLYIGIGRPRDNAEILSYVLGEPTDSQKAELERAVERVGRSILQLAETPVDRVMNELNKNE